MKAKIGAYPKDRQELHKILPLETPLAIDFHLTHICNFKCNFCVHSTGIANIGGKPFKKEAMDWDLFELFVEQCKAFPDKIKTISLAGLGEPLTHPRIADMVKLLKQSDKFGIVQIISNASLLTPQLGQALVDAGLDRLKISLQGLNDNTYYRVTGVKQSFNKIYENIKYFSQIKGKTQLYVKIGDISLEEGEESKFYELFGDICDSVGVEHIYDMWETNDVDVSAVVKPTTKNCWGYEQREIRTCRHRFTTMDVLPDGTFVLSGCHRRFGFEKNIREASIKEQWNSDAANKLRISMLKNGRAVDPVCRKCQFVTMNWHPIDLLEGHEEEILQRMEQSK